MVPNFSLQRKEQENPRLVARVEMSLLPCSAMGKCPFPSLFHLLQAYMFKCVLSCFKYIKASNREEVKVEPQAVEKVRKSEFTPESGPKAMGKGHKNELIPEDVLKSRGKGEEK